MRNTALSDKLQIDHCSKNLIGKLSTSSSIGPSVSKLGPDRLNDAVKLHNKCSSLSSRQERIDRCARQ